MSSIYVLDTETTGLDHTKDTLVEYAHVQLDADLNVIDHFQSLINPGEVPILAEASAAHHLTRKDVIDAPTKDIIPSLPVDSLLVAHNAKFDRGFLPQFQQYTWLCTWKVARAIVDNSPSYSNQVLRYYLNLEPLIPVSAGLAAHRALYDCYVTAALLRHLVTLAPLAELIAISNKPVLLKVITFGKHKGIPWKDAPRPYLYWITSQPSFDEDVMFTAKHYLNGEKQV